MRGACSGRPVMADEDVVPGPSLASIDPELQLLIFQSFRRGCATACLCQLEKTCKAFSTVAQLPSRAGNEDEGLSLPEIAARLLMARALALPVRPDGLKPFRPYERGPGEGHKHALNLLERGLLTRGVLHDVPESAVERTGWKLAYSEPYCHRTQASDLERVPASARYVLVAAIFVGPERRDEGFAARAVRTVFGRLELANPFASTSTTPAGGAAGGAAEERRYRPLAWGRRESVLKVTHSEQFAGMGSRSDNEDEGVYWYRWARSSFGFSSHPDLWLYLADAGIKQHGFEERPDDRLSWNLDSRSTGGWRAGRVYDLGDSTEWVKRVYYR